MPKRAVSTANAAPAGGPYSQAVVAGDTVYLAGAVPARPDGSLDQAVRVGVYLRDFGDFAAMNEIYAQYFTGDSPPVRTTLPVALEGMDIEVDAVLYLG